MADDLLLLEGADSLLLESGGDSLSVESDAVVSLPAGASYLLAGQHWTDCREYRRGRRPGDWTLLLGAEGSTRPIRVEGAFVDAPHRSVIRLTGQAGVGTRLLTWDAPDADTNRADQETCSRFRVVRQTGTTISVAVLRASASGSTETSYRLRLLWSAQQVEISKVVAGVATSLTTYGKALRTGTFYRCRFRVEGTSLKVRVWYAGTIEPAIWDTTVTDASIADGSVGLRVASGSTDIVEVAYFAAATNGGTATSEEDALAGDPPLDQWITDPELELEKTTRVEYFNPDTGLVESQWISDLGRTTGASDYPANTIMDALLLDTGTLTSRLEADVQLGGAALPARSAMRFRNVPEDPDSPRPLDSWVRYSFAGRPVEVRLGRRWRIKPAPGIAGQLTPHRRFEIVGCAVAGGGRGDQASEPDIGAEEVVMPLGSPTALLSEKVPVRHNVGISTGVKNLTSSGWLSIPSSTAYDLTSYAVYLRLYIPAAGLTGTGLAEISKREAAGTAYLTWFVGLYQASHTTTPNQLRFAVHSSAGAVIIAQNADVSGYLGRWVDVVLAVKGSDRWYALVGESGGSAGLARVGSGTLTANPNTGSGSTVQVLRSGVVSAVLCDHRIEQWVDEDEARGRFSTRRDPDSLTISMHRCDDNGGSGVADYAPLGNDGTLQGTDAVDRQWEPTYLGSAEVTGVPMPMSAGVVFHAPTQVADPLRNIFRWNDRAGTAGTEVEVRAKGLLLVGGGTDYTEPATGPGTVDFVGAADQPVTYGSVSDPPAPEDERTHVVRLLRDELVTVRGAMDASTCDLDSFAGLRQLLPFRGGWHYDQPPEVGKLMTEVLGPVGAYYGLSSDSRAFTNCLTPPVGPGPYGDESAMLEFLGQPDRGVTFSPDPAFDLDQVLTSGRPWFGLAALVRMPLRWRDSSASLGTYFPTGMTIVDRTDGASGYYLGLDGRTGAIVFGAPGVTGTVTGLHHLSYQYPYFAPGGSFLIYGYQDYNTRKIGVIDMSDPPGTAVTTTAVESTAGAMTPATDAPLRIGHGPQGSFWGWIGQVIGSSSVLSEGDFVDSSGVDLYEVRTTPWNGYTVSAFRWGQTQFLIALDEGEGDVAYETKTGLAGQIEGCRWSPRAVFDFRSEGAESSFPGARRPVPAWRVDSRFRRNYAPVVGANVAVAVSAADRAALAQPSLSEPDASQDTRTNYLNSRDVELQTPLASAADADTVSRMVRSRLDTDRRFADAQDWPIDAVRLNLTDEVLVYADREGFESGKRMRVDELRVRLADLETDLGFWG